MDWAWEEKTISYPDAVTVFVTPSSVSIIDTQSKKDVSASVVHDAIVNGELVEVTIIAGGEVRSRNRQSESRYVEDVITVNWRNINEGSIKLIRGDGTRILVPLYPNETVRFRESFKVLFRVRNTSSSWLRFAREIAKSVNKIARYRRGTVISK